MHIRLIPHYIFWHYTRGITDMLQVMKRLLRSVAKLFSLRLMFRTFFDPFERLGEHYRGGGISGFFETFIVNTLMRMVGMLVRFCIILIGTISWICVLIFALAGVFVWLFLPLILCACLYFAAYNLIKAI